MLHTKADFDLQTGTMFQGETMPPVIREALEMRFTLYAMIDLAARRAAAVEQGVLSDDPEYVVKLRDALVDVVKTPPEVMTMVREVFPQFLPLPNEDKWLAQLERVRLCDDLTCLGNACGVLTDLLNWFYETLNEYMVNLWKETSLKALLAKQKEEEELPKP